MYWVLVFELLFCIFALLASAMIARVIFISLVYWEKEKSIDEISEIYDVV